MKLQFIIISILLLLGTSVMSQKAFEGIIIYKVDTHLKKKNHPYNEYFSQKYGDTLRVTIKQNGNMKREFIGSGELGYEWAIYDQNKNEFYTKWKSMDSIFYYDCGEVITDLQSFESVNGTTKILDKDCESIVIHSIEPNLNEHIHQKFFFSGDEKIIEGTYDGFKDGYLNRVYAQSKSHILRWEFEQMFVRVEFEAVSIEWKPIDNDVFKIPKGITLVKS
ncbi:MAG: hypothetical protein MI974_28900 [Chitinophagales bacterium]|nr:hypothetical protein [Chitinophagales bacterium]